MHLGMTYTEVRRLPVRYRTWFINRLSKHFKDKTEARQNRGNQSQNTFNRDAFDKFEKTVNQKL